MFIMYLKVRCARSFQKYKKRRESEGEMDVHRSAFKQNKKMFISHQRDVKIDVTP